MKRAIFSLFFLIGTMGGHDAQVPDPQGWNTGINTPVGALDPHWRVAVGDTVQPTGAFVPAKVVGNCGGTWPNGAPPNADWIAHDFGAGCAHLANGCVDLYFRREVVLPATNACGAPIEGNFCLEMDFWADNNVYRVSVNDVVNFQYYDPLNPYNYSGIQHLENAQLCEGWMAGNNVLLVHTRSCPTVAGLLAIAKPQIAPPKAFLGDDVAVCFGESATLNSPFDSTIWFDGTVSKSKTVVESGLYSATIRDAEGCAITDTIAVKFPVQAFVPNAFSPNDDQQNDCFSAFFSEIDFDFFDFQIFDRWGNMVFRSNDPANCWDGKFRGKDCLSGIYVYFIALENGLCARTVLRGDLTLLR
jgi:gliding motility-associated-like protein